MSRPFLRGYRLNGGITKEEYEYLSGTLGPYTQTPSSRLDKAQLENLAATSRYLIQEGQKTLSPDDFKAPGHSLYQHLGRFAIIGLIGSLLIAVVVSWPGDKSTWSLRSIMDTWDQHLAQILLGGLVAFWAAIIYTQWRQEKEIAFKLVEGLNSSDFGKYALRGSKARASHNRPSGRRHRRSGHMVSTRTDIFPGAGGFQGQGYFQGS